jgi:hypothetical protein
VRAVRPWLLPALQSFDLPLQPHHSFSITSMEQLIWIWRSRNLLLEEEFNVKQCKYHSCSVMNVLGLRSFSHLTVTKFIVHQERSRIESPRRSTRASGYGCLQIRSLRKTCRLHHRRWESKRSRNVSLEGDFNVKQCKYYILRSYEYLQIWNLRKTCMLYHRRWVEVAIWQSPILKCWYILHLELRRFYLLNSNGSGFQGVTILGVL